MSTLRTGQEPIHRQSKRSSKPGSYPATPARAAEFVFFVDGTFQITQELKNGAIFDIGEAFGGSVGEFTGTSVGNAAGNAIWP